VLPPLAVQLYTLRNQAERDFAFVLERVAQIGYVGVETAGLYGMSAKDFRDRLDDLGLRITSAVVSLPDNADAHLVIAEQQLIGNDVVIASLPPEDFVSHDAVKRAAAYCNRSFELLRREGMTLGYHNHWWEFERSSDGLRPMTTFIEHLDPDIFLEADIYWIQTAGLEPGPTLLELGNRVRRLHIKDGPCTKVDPQTAVGSGTVDIVAALAAAPHVEWHVAELDECVGDMFEAIAASYRYLTDRGLSAGRRI
jgi:sugar phosphate isomerase/epimerase